MKKFKLLLLSFAAITFSLSSCSDTADETVITEPGTPASLSIKFSNPSTSRASGLGNFAAESKITNGMIFVFRPSGVLDGHATFTDASTAVNVKITAGERDVYVVTNITPADFASVNQKTDLFNLTQKATLANLTGKSLSMSGEALAVDASSATLAVPAQVSIELSFICAKTTINWDLTQIPGDMSGFTVTGAYVLNVKNKSDYFSSASTVALTSNVLDYSYGRDDITTFTGSYLPTSSFTNTYSDSLKLADLVDKGNNHFYLFENSIVASPTIIVIEGTFTENSITTIYYYPIVINGSQNTSGGDNSFKVVRGKNYTVTAVIKGFGNIDPYEPITNAAIDVTITTKDWIPVNISQEFN